MIPAFLAQGCKVVDLSADFRFRDISLYEQWYQAHTAPELNAEAVYGLPELHRDEVRHDAAWWAIRAVIPPASFWGWRLWPRPVCWFPIR